MYIGYFQGQESLQGKETCSVVVKDWRKTTTDWLLPTHALPFSFVLHPGFPTGPRFCQAETPCSCKEVSTLRQWFCLGKCMTGNAAGSSEALRHSVSFQALAFQVLSNEWQQQWCFCSKRLLAALIMVVQHPTLILFPPQDSMYFVSFSKKPFLLKL